MGDRVQPRYPGEAELVRGVPGTSPKIETRIARGPVGIEDVGDRAADDRSRCKRHVLPAFARRRLVVLALASVMAWLDDQRKAGKAGEIGDASIRHNMNLLSRIARNRSRSDGQSDPALWRCRL